MACEADGTRARGVLAAPSRPSPFARPSSWRRVTRFFALDTSFPSARLVVRSPTGRMLLLLSEQVLLLLRADCLGELKVVQCGVRLFEKEEAKGAMCP